MFVFCHPGIFFTKKIFHDYHQCVVLQADQRLCYSLFWKVSVSKLATGEISIDKLVSVAEETGLSLPLSEVSSRQDPFEELLIDRQNRRETSNDSKSSAQVS